MSFQCVHDVKTKSTTPGQQDEEIEEEMKMKIKWNEKKTLIYSLKMIE